jgi:phage shock protein E
VSAAAYLRSLLACRTKGLSFCRVAPFLAIALLALTMLTACSPQATFKNVSIADLQARPADALVLDVREPWEYAEGHVAGATLIPLAQVADRAGEVPADKPVYVICRSGNRSAQASEALVKAGKRDIRNVEGGMLAWEAAGYPVER